MRLAASRNRMHHMRLIVFGRYWLDCKRCDGVTKGCRLYSLNQAIIFNDLTIQCRRIQLKVAFHIGLERRSKSKFSTVPAGYVVHKLHVLVIYYAGLCIIFGDRATCRRKLAIATAVSKYAPLQSRGQSRLYCGRVANTTGGKRTGSEGTPQPKEVSSAVCRHLASAASHLHISDRNLASLSPNFATRRAAFVTDTSTTTLSPSLLWI